jgi:hypothetical protein
MTIQMDIDNVTEAINYLNEFSKKEGLYLFPSVPLSNLSTPSVDVPENIKLETFLSLVKYLDCKILYYEVTLFDVVFEYGDDLEIIKYENKIIIEKELEIINKKWEQMIDKPMSIEIVFYYNDVSHKFELCEAWLEDYNEDIRNIQERILAFEEDEKKEEFEESERLTRKKREYIELNKENWCRIVAKDTKFQRAKSFEARATIVLTLIPELEKYTYGSDRYLIAPGCNSVIDMIIQNSMEIAERILKDQIYDLHNKGKSGRSIAGILELSEHKVSKVLAKLKK